MNLQENNLFIERIKNSKFIQQIKGNYEVIMIYLGGSRSLGLVDQISDYDLVVVVKNDPESEEGVFKLGYENTHVHWYYRTINQIINTFNSPHTYLSYISGINFYNIENNIIYENPLYQKEINFIKQNKKDIVKNNCWDFILSSPTFFSVISQGEIAPLFTKFIYHLCVCNYILFNKEFDKDFLLKIKRIRYSKNPKEELKEELDKAYLLIQELYNNQISSSEREQLKNKLNTKLKEVN